MSRALSTPLAVMVCLAGLAVAQCDDSPTEPGAAPCSYAISPTSTAEPAAGGTGSISLVTAGQCPWSASTADNWLTVLTTTGAGTGKVDYRVASNDSTDSRVGHLVIQNLVVTVAQAGRAPCSYDVAPKSLTFAGTGGSGLVHVTAQAECVWAASTNTDWLTVTSPGPGKGTGDVTVSVTPYSGNGDRTAVLTVGGVGVNISQTPQPAPPPAADCDYTVAPTEFVLHWHQTGGDVNLTTTAGGCTWSVTPGSDWLSLSTPDHGSGSTTLTFANSIWTQEASRRAPVQVRWPTPTAGQNVWITQEGCRFALAKTTQSMPVAGGSDRITVFADPVSADCPLSCTFTGTSNATWLRITSQGTNPGMRGDGWISYTVDPNTTGAVRTGVIRVEQYTLTITQAGT